MDFIEYEKGVLKTPSFLLNDDMSEGVGAVYFRKMKEHSHKIAQTEPISGNFDTYSSLLQKCVRTALALKNRGIKKGDFICLCCDQRLNGSVPLLAAYMIGAVPFALEPSMSLEDMMQLLNQVHPNIIFSLKDSEEIIRKTLASSCTSVEIVVFERDFEREFLKPQPDEASFEPYRTNDLKETATLYFSSGSTGLPKAICITHYQMVCYFETASKEAKESQCVFYNPSNWYWGSSGAVLFTGTMLGANILYDPFDKYKLWYWIDKYKISKLYLPGIDYIEFSETVKPKDIDVSSLKTISSIGAPVHLDYIHKLRNLLPNCITLQVYGMTEIGVLTMFECNTELHRKFAIEKPTSIGLPALSLWLKVVEVETNAALGPNQPGQLKVKTSKIMHGYYNKDCSDQFDDDGWFKTGDLVYYDEEFCFYFINRLKDRIDYKGWWIYPSKLENILTNHPAVKIAVVFGKPDKRDEELVTAAVCLNEDYFDKVSAEDIAKYSNDQIEDDRQKIRGGVYIFKSMPLNNAGKVNRILVKNMVLKNI